MKTKPSKLKLDKKTISNLNETDVNGINGGAAGCSADFCSKGPKCLGELTIALATITLG
jgi:hypothetical protein